MASLPGVPVAMVAVGGVLVWSGIENEPVTAVFRGLAGGKAPAKGHGEVFATPAAPGAVAPAATLPGGPASSSAIASDALRYVGHPYLYGGAPGPSGTQPWDCSSFCNWVLGHDLGLVLPGGVSGYDGSSHGPTTIGYLTWGQAQTVGHNGDAARAGDLAVWQTHMGICTGPNQMISAQDPANGTQVSPINGQIPEILFIRRIALAGAPA